MSYGASLDPFASFCSFLGDGSFRAKIFNRSGYCPDGSIDSLEFFNESSGFLRIKVLR